jgi:hypothetical protein
MPRTVRCLVRYVYTAILATLTGVVLLGIRHQSSGDPATLKHRQEAVERFRAAWPRYQAAKTFSEKEAATEAVEDAVIDTARLDAIRRNVLAPPLRSAFRVTVEGRGVIVTRGRWLDENGWKACYLVGPDDAPVRVPTYGQQSD